MKATGKVKIGKPVNWSAVARRAGVSRHTVYRWRDQTVDTKPKHRAAIVRALLDEIGSDLILIINKTES